MVMNLIFEPNLTEDLNKKCQKSNGFQIFARKLAIKQVSLHCQFTAKRTKKTKL